MPMPAPKLNSQFGETLRSIAGTEFSFSSVRIPGKRFFEPAHSTTDLNSAGNETGAVVAPERRLATALQIHILRTMPDEVRNISDLLARRAVAAPDKPLLFSESDGRQFSYAEFAASVNRAVRMLAALVVAKGDVVSVLILNCAE